MKRPIIVIFFMLLATLFATESSQACDSMWMHMGGVSKHFQVYQPTAYTQYRRQTHPGIGAECHTAWLTVSAGQFTNSIDHDFNYASLSKDVLGRNLKLYVGVLAGQYGRDQGPLNFAMPVAYLEYRYRNVGINVFALPPAHGWNDYLVMFAQFKMGFDIKG